METKWENTLYHFAHQCMDTSWEKWNDHQVGKSWGYTLPARLGYLCNAIVSIVVLPFAAIKVVFGALQSLYTKNATPLKISWKYLIERSDEVFLGILGSAISPAMIHYYQNQKDAPDASKWLNCNITYIFYSIKGTITLGGMLYYML